MNLYTCLISKEEFLFLNGYWDTYLFWTLTFFCYLLDVDEITSPGAIEDEVTEVLKYLFLFAAVWSLGGTISAESRSKFDVFFRSLVGGTDLRNPIPKNITLDKNNLFPKGGSKISAWKIWIFLQFV